LSKPFRVSKEEETLIKIMRAVEVPAERILSIIAKDSPVMAALIKRVRKEEKTDVTKTV